MLAGGLVFVVAVGFEKADLENVDGTLAWFREAQLGSGADETPSVAILTFAV